MAQAANVSSIHAPQARSKPPVISSKALAEASSYPEWRAIAQGLDQRSGADRWKQRDATARYDYRTIRARLDEINKLMQLGDPQALLFYLNEGIHGNMGGMGSSKLYTKALYGTKDLVFDYTTAVAQALRQIAATPASEVSLAHKLEFFRRASVCFGRTALMLSGAGSLGPFHIGVVKALHERNLLPDVISGASAGSMVAAMVGTHGNDDLQKMLHEGDIVNGLSEAQKQTDQAVAEQGGNRSARLNADSVKQLIAALIPDLTFEEAFELTGRKINISVSPKDYQQNSRLLNAVTSPNVMIREAVLASCAVPGVYPPVALAAKNSEGQRQPYVANRRWVDGSITDDMPAKRLTRLYGVNHFIASQTNPLALLTLRRAELDDTLLGRYWEIGQSAYREWMKATYPLAMSVTQGIPALSTMTRTYYSVMTQDYTADINVIPSQRFFDPRKLLSPLTPEDTSRLILDGERSTWPKLSMIRNCSLVSRTLDDILDQLDIGMHPSA